MAKSTLRSDASDPGSSIASSNWLRVHSCPARRVNSSRSLRSLRVNFTVEPSSRCAVVKSGAKATPP